MQDPLLTLAQYSLEKVDDEQVCAVRRGLQESWRALSGSAMGQAPLSSNELRVCVFHFVMGALHTATIYNDGEIDQALYEISVAAVAIGLLDDSDSMEGWRW